MVRPSAANDALQRISRFYKVVAVQPAEGGYSVTLDQRTLSTPDKAPLVVPTEAAAQMIADEWDAQKEFIRFPDMPATRHAFTSIDRVSRVRAEVARECARYAGSDLLCYYAEAPANLIEREKAAWGPILDWAEQELGLSFIRASGVSPLSQPAQTLLRVEAMALDLDDFRLAAVAFAGALFGSTVLALAVERGRLTGPEAYDLSRIDETFQEEQWGVDSEAAERTENLRVEAAILDRWLRALG